ncbi:MAG: hypothetical protein PVH19_15275 [Planctomycetia bacterium]
MSLYEPKKAETNEAFPTTPSSSDLSHDAQTHQTPEVVFRLPDLAQMDAEPEREVHSAEIQKPAEPSPTPPPPFKRRKKKSSPFDFFSGWKSTDKARLRRTGSIAAMLLFAGVLGFGVARVTDRLGLYSGGPTPECPAPNASEAPLFQSPQPQYAADTLPPPPTSEAPESKLPIDITTPKLEITNYEPTTVAENQIGQPQNSTTQPANSAYPAPWNSAYPSKTTPSTPIPTGPNVQQNPVFAQTGTNQGVNTQVNPSNRFSPERVQEVLQNQQGAVQTVQYPQTQPNMTNPPSTSYPSTSVATVAQRPTHQSYPTPTNYQPTTAVPPVSPYPPATGVYQTPAGHTTQNWPAEHTYVPPSTTQPYQQSMYPTTNQYPYPTQNTVAQPPAATHVYR